MEKRARLVVVVTWPPGEGVALHELVDDLAGEFRGQAAALPVLHELGSLPRRVGRELQGHLVRDGELGLALGSDLRPLRASGAERPGQGAGDRGEDQETVTGPGAREALEDAGDADDPVVGVEGPRRLPHPGDDAVPQPVGGHRRPGVSSGIHARKRRGHGRDAVDGHAARRPPAGGTLPHF